eukprot:TRINITY_DN10964_c1_g2_i1.p3 TRINITY_DN10964_c1_g2~~TRINITY_DN10964_c1_g2_i1.p3  ORF type:complete len:101 (+),score=1.00 TRINITY_DN10964_c1_g2_i1:92-394(+)
MDHQCLLPRESGVVFLCGARGPAGQGKLAGVLDGRKSAHGGSSGVISPAGRESRIRTSGCKELRRMTTMKHHATDLSLHAHDDDHAPLSVRLIEFKKSEQ